jgi:hypothetical protein
MIVREEDVPAIREAEKTVKRFIEEASKLEDPKARFYVLELLREGALAMGRQADAETEEHLKSMQGTRQ